MSGVAERAQGTPAGAPPARVARPRRRWPLAAAAVLLVALALVLRIAYLDATPGYVLRHDAIDYDRHAHSIALGRGYSDTFAHGRPTAFRPPAYPYFLAGVYRLAGVERANTATRVHAARVAGVVVGTVLAGLVGLLALLLWGPFVALLALGLAAVYVPFITVGGAVMSEPLFTALMLGALCAVVAHRRSGHRRRYVVLAGVLSGLAILARANALVLLLPLGLAVWTARPRWSWRALAAPVLLVALALAVLAPWTLRNARVLHAFVPVSTQLGSALAGTYNDEARADRANPASWRSIKHVARDRDLWVRLHDLPEPVVEQRLRARSLAFIRKHPFYVAEVGFWNAARMVDVTGLRRSRATAATISIDRRWADRTVFCFWLFAVLAVAGAFTRAARTTPFFVWAVPILLVLSVVFLTLETPRYRTPDDPFVILLAALALAAAAHKGVRPRKGSLTGRAAGPGRPRRRREDRRRDRQGQPEGDEAPHRRGAASCPPTGLSATPPRRPSWPGGCSWGA